MSKIFLIGLPGSGKSTLGKQVAHHLHTRFIDLDTAIEVSQGRSVPDIFNANGEAHFRVLENQMLTACIHNQPDFVMATGGGTPCFYNNMPIMNNAGTTIFLDIPIVELVQRLEATNQGRPLLAGTNPDQLLEKLRSLYETRLPYYQQAKITMRLSNPTLGDVVAQLEREA